MAAEAPARSVPAGIAGISSAAELDEFATSLVQQRHAAPRTPRQVASERWRKIKTAINFSSRIAASAGVGDAGTDMLGESLAAFANQRDDSWHGAKEAERGLSPPQRAQGGAAPPGESARRQRVQFNPSLAAAIAKVDGEQERLRSRKGGDSAQRRNPTESTGPTPGAERAPAGAAPLEQGHGTQQQQHPQFPSHGSLRDSMHGTALPTSPSPTMSPEGGSSPEREGELKPLRVSRFQPRGKRGVETLRVRYDRRLYCFIADIYVNSLKMPRGWFVLAVFSAPVLLSLLFTPLFLFGVSGLQFEDGVLHKLPQAPASLVPNATHVPSLAGRATTGSLGTWGSWGGEEAAAAARVAASAAAAPVETGASTSAADWLRAWSLFKRSLSIVVHVFLYSLSLSTTFGGSPVSACSPFTLILANINTLMAQFLFVFLSGAVFARMSQPSNPVRCSKKAIIRNDDFVPTPSSSSGGVHSPGGHSDEQHRALVTRLVLTGPDPCELVDVKIRLIFRCFVRQGPSGSVFVSTTDLPLVRSESSYLRYGLSVRHIITPTSPLYGHTAESLLAGDACFALALLGTERSSMQPIFHMHEYYVFDGDVVWGGDYQDIVSMDQEGNKVMVHDRIDLLKPFKASALASQAISRMGLAVKRGKQDGAPPSPEKAANAAGTSFFSRLFNVSSVRDFFDPRRLASFGALTGHWFEEAQPEGPSRLETEGEKEGRADSSPGSGTAQRETGWGRAAEKMRSEDKKTQ